MLKFLQLQRILIRILTSRSKKGYYQENLGRKFYKEIVKSKSKRLNHREIGEVTKSVRGMPRLSEAKKDVISCDKLWVGAHDR